MKIAKYYLLVSCIFTFLNCVSFSQKNQFSIIVTDSLPVNFENIYNLNELNIIPSSEIIKVRGKFLSKKDYTFDYAASTFSISDSFPHSIFDTIFVTYKTIKLSLKKEYKHRSLMYKYDDKFGDTLRISKVEYKPYSSDFFFGKGIEKSGTIVRGFTVGTNKDFSLQSGLRLQLAGKLSDDIEVVAALTDENTPIQPEGNTERLDELDKVFIQIKHKNASGTFGDYDLQNRFGEFGIINRKLQGLLGTVSFENFNGFSAIASSKGKFNSNKFNGQDGVQGPYRLTGINNEKDIIIIAGSEKIFLDGEELKRGDRNDYVIEYSNAQVTFTPNRLITSASRISIDFEYTDRRFVRNIFGAGTSSALFDKKINLKFQYLREGDNQDSPIDISLSDEDKNILSLAGDDISKAMKSGVSFALPDSTGKITGVYEKRDTIVNNLKYEYYVYNPGSINSIYNVSFTYVGVGQGDYLKESIGTFRFAGKNNGDYLPLIFLPLPELKQFGNFVIETNPFENIFFNLEFAGSSWDKNRFSSFNDDDNLGYARNIFFKVNPTKIKIGEMNFGKVGIFYKDRFIQDRFTAVDRFNEVEFVRNYNLSSIQKNENESLREIGITIIPINQINIASSFGFLKRGESFKSNRYNNFITIEEEKKYQIKYNFDFVSTETSGFNSNWSRHKANAFYFFWKLKPGFELNAEDKKDKKAGRDSLFSGSLKYLDANPFLEFINFYGFDFIYRYTFREDYFAKSGLMIKESKSLGHSIDVSYKGLQFVNSSLKIVLRDKYYSNEFKQLGFLDNKTILVRSQTKLNFNDAAINDLFYEVSTQKTAKLERVFVRVEKGKGNYKYLGDLNNNGISDENEFEPTLFDGDFIIASIPTDQLFPIIDLKASSRWKINFERFFYDKTVIGNMLQYFSFENYIRIEENSQEQDLKKIYLLQLSNFLNDKNTIRGSILMQQDIFLFENSSDLSFRFRFTQKRSLNQFSSGTERGFNNERSIRIKFKMIKEISNQTDLINQNDNMLAPDLSNRNRQIESNNVVSDFSYWPERNIDIGFKIKVGQSIDNFPIQPTIINNNLQSIRINFSFAGTGRIRVEVERNELNANTSNNFIPFELTGGYLIGKNYSWRLNLDYRFAANLQSTASYDGRVQGGGRVIHTAKAEVRAFF